MHMIKKQKRDTAKDNFVEKRAHFRKDTDFGFSIVGSRPIAISKVRSDGPAARAGVTVGDFLLRVNGKRVTEADHEAVVKVIQSLTEIELVVLRRKKPLDASANPNLSTTGSENSSTQAIPNQIESSSSANESEAQSETGALKLGSESLSVERLDTVNSSQNQSQKPSPLRISVSLSLQPVQLDSADGATIKDAEPRLSIDSFDEQDRDLDNENDNDNDNVPDSPSFGTKRSSVSLNVQQVGDRDGDDEDECEDDGTQDSVSLCDVDTLMRHSKSEKQHEAAASCSRLSAAISLRPRAFSMRKPKLSTASSVSPDRARSPSIRQRARSSQPSGANAAAAAAASFSIDGNHSGSDDRRISEMGSRDSVGIDVLPPQQTPAAAVPDIKDKQLSAADMKRLLVFSSEANDEIGNEGAESATQAMFNSAEELPARSSFSLTHANDCTVFEDSAKCLRHPAQLAIYLNYAWRNAQTDLYPLLFTVVADNYQVICTQQGPAIKDMRKWAYEIFSAFLIDHSPLSIAAQLNADAYRAAVDTLENVLWSRFDKEDVMRSAFSEFRRLALDRCSEQIREFSAKVLASGLGTLYGFQQLTAAMTYDSERWLLETNVNSILEQLIATYKLDWTLPLNQSSATVTREVNEARGLLIAALQTLAKQYGLQMSLALGDKYPVFNAKTKRSQFFKRSSSKVFPIRNHHFTPHHFFTRTYCAVCRGLLAGVGSQGYQCGVCEIAVHTDCARLTNETCHKLDKAAAERERAQDRDKKRHSNALGSLTGTLSGVIRRQNPSLPHSASAISPRPDTWLATSASRSNAEDNEFADVDDPIRKHSEFESNHVILPPAGRRAKSEVDRAVLEAVLREADEFSTHTGAPIIDTFASGDASSTLNSREDDRESSYYSSSVPTVVSSSVAAKWREDPDLDAPADMPPLDSIVPEALLKKLKPKEKELQKVLNELLYTERSHLRNLKVLLHLFYQSWPKERELDELRVWLMPNLSELVELHKQFGADLQTSRDRDSNVIDAEQVANVLTRWFVGDPLQRWKNLCSTYCQFHSQGIAMLRIKRKKDPRFDDFLSSCEADSLCRRLQINGLIPVQTQRLTKYPLLIESAIKQWTALMAQRGGGGACLENFKSAAVGMKSVLQTVNERVRECENQFRWTEIQKRIDRAKFEAMTNDLRYSAYKGFAFAKHRMIYDGPLQWRLNKERRLDCHLVLLDSHLLLLRKEDDRLILKSHSVLITDGKDEKKHVTPIVSLATDLYHVREDAREKRGFLLLAAAYMYELCTISAEERRKWIDVIVQQVQLCKAAATAAKDSTVSSPKPDSDTVVTTPPVAASTTSQFVVDSSVSSPPDVPQVTSVEDAAANGSGSVVEELEQLGNDDTSSKLVNVTVDSEIENADVSKDASSGAGDSKPSARRQVSSVDTPRGQLRPRSRKRSSSLSDRSAVSRLQLLSRISDDGDDDGDGDCDEELTRYLELGRRDGDVTSSIREKRRSITESHAARLVRHESDSCRYERSSNGTSEGWASRTFSMRLTAGRSRRRSLINRKNNAKQADDSASASASRSPSAFSPSRPLRKSTGNAVEELADENFAALLRRRSSAIRPQEKEVQVSGNDPEFLDSSGVQGQSDLDRIISEIDAHDTAIRNALSEKQRLVDHYLRLQSASESNPQSADSAVELPHDEMHVTKTAVEQAVEQAQKVLSFLNSSDLLNSSSAASGAGVGADEVFVALPTDAVLNVLGGLNRHLTDLLRLLSASCPTGAKVASPPVLSNSVDQSTVHRSASASPVRSRVEIVEIADTESNVEQDCSHLLTEDEAQNGELDAGKAVSVTDESIVQPSNTELAATSPPITVDADESATGQSEILVTQTASEADVIEPDGKTDAEDGEALDTIDTPMCIYVDTDQDQEQDEVLILNNSPLQTYTADC